jgi:hypothetical protein
MTAKQPKTFRALALETVRRMLDERRESAVDVVEAALRDAAARAREIEAETIDRTVRQYAKDPSRFGAPAIVSYLRGQAKQIREGLEERIPQEGSAS